MILLHHIFHLRSILLFINFWCCNFRKYFRKNKQRNNQQQNKLAKELLKLFLKKLTIEWLTAVFDMWAYWRILENARLNVLQVIATPVPNSQILPDKIDNLVVIAYKVKKYCHSFFSCFYPAEVVLKISKQRKQQKRKSEKTVTRSVRKIVVFNFALSSPSKSCLKITGENNYTQLT